MARCKCLTCFVDHGSDVVVELNRGSGSEEKHSFSAPQSQNKTAGKQRGFSLAVLWERKRKREREDVTQLKSWQKVAGVCFLKEGDGGVGLSVHCIKERPAWHLRVNILLFQSLQFPGRKRMFGLGSHVCCLRNYKYTPRHFQVKGWGNANTQAPLAREREQGEVGGGGR